MSPLARKLGLNILFFLYRVKGQIVGSCMHAPNDMKPRRIWICYLLYGSITKPKQKVLKGLQWKLVTPFWQFF